MADSDVAYAGVRRRLSMCLEILGLRERLASAPAAAESNAKVLTANRVRSIRRVLLDRPEKSLVDELLSPKTGFARLKSLLDESSTGSDADRTVVATYAREIYGMLCAIQRSEVDSGIRDVVGGHPAVTDAIEAIPAWFSGEQNDPLVDISIERGKFGEDFREGIEHAAAVPPSSSLRIEDVSPELARQQESAKAQSESAYAAYRLVSAAYRQACIALNNATDQGASGAELTALEQARQAEADRQTAAYIEYTDVFSAAYSSVCNEVSAAMQKARDDAMAPIADIGKKAIGAVLDASPVTLEAAAQWAESVEITKAAANRLRKMGYAADQMRADIAEFYRFVGGRVGTIRIDSKGDRRANAAKIYAKGSAGVVYLAGSFDKRVLWHELGHHIEADPVARAAAGRFIRRRSVDDGKAHKLRQLAGHNGYRSDEVAYKNGFFDPYVGKIYSDGVTEVFSMGIESFSNPLTLGRRMITDPQTLEFVSGFLKTEQTPLAKAFMGLRESMRELNDSSKEETKSSYEDLLESLAEGFDITPDDATPEEAAHWTNEKMIGRLGDTGWLVFSGKVRNWETKRKANGLILYRFSIENGYMARDVRQFSTTDQTIVRAAFALYQQQGVMPQAYEMTDANFLRKHAK